MRGIQLVWNRERLGRYGLTAGLSFLLIQLAGSLAMAGALFSGVTGIEAGKLSPDGVQSLSFQSDLPFHYQMQVQDRNHVILRLYQARLADNLLTPEGGVNLLTGGAIESASLKKSTSGEYQEIVLTGPGLGDKKLKVTGATELPLTLSGMETSSPLKLSKPVAQERSTNTQSSRPAKGMETATKIESGSTNQKNSKAFQKLTQEPLAMMAVPITEPAPVQSRSGPQIASVTNATGSPVGQSRPTGPLVIENNTRSMASAAPVSTTQPQVQAVASPVSEASAFIPETAPEPAYQILAPLPRYQGGAAPIQAMTTDSQGKPVLLRSKNQAIPEFAIESDGDGYNALFQAETDGPQQKVGKLMADALTAYRGKQYSEALSRIQQALTLDADNADLYAALGEIQIKLNQLPQSVAAYQKASAKVESKYGQRYAQVLVLAGKRQEAIQVLKAMHQRDGKQVQVVYMLGTLYEELGQTAEALPYLKQAAALHPASADIQYNLGLAYELTGDRLQAEKHYQQALSLNSSAKDVHKALARVKSD